MGDWLDTLTRRRWHKKLSPRETGRIIGEAVLAKLNGPVVPEHLLSPVETNRTWLNAVANIIERDGHFPLEKHDVVRLREIVEQLKEQ